jgi:hypothetical protein
MIPNDYFRCAKYDPLKPPFDYCSYCERAEVPENLTRVIWGNPMLKYTIGLKGTDKKCLSYIPKENK